MGLPGVNGCYQPLLRYGVPKLTLHTFQSCKFHGTSDCPQGPNH